MPSAQCIETWTRTGRGRWVSSRPMVTLVDDLSAFFKNLVLEDGLGHSDQLPTRSKMGMSDPAVPQQRDFGSVAHLLHPPPG
jgi:hypothetical protein